jgi:molybdopterin-binding protein
MARSASATSSPPSAAPPTVPNELSLAERVCLALVTQQVSHGWAVGTMLAPEGELGRVWSLSRALTYRAIEGLVDKGLVLREGQEAGRGRDRVRLAPTATGRRLARKWLDQPVEHLRDVRTELLVKLVLRERAGLDNGPLLEAQQARFAETIEALSAAHGDDDVVDLWRRESARAVRRFLDRALGVPAPAAQPQLELRLSARNQLRGTITSVRTSEMMSSVHGVLDDGQPLTAVITHEAAQELDLAPGDAVLFIVKSTEVMVAKAPDAGETGRHAR